MKRNVLIFGIILGMIISMNIIYTVHLVYNNPDFIGNDVVGYTAMVVVFSLTFFGIRNYRNKELNGVITFGRAFKTGALIAILGSTIYVAFWLFYYYTFVPDFLEKYNEHVMLRAQVNGATPAMLVEKKKEMDNFNEMYKNPVFVILMTYAEVLPVGLVVALISSLILKRKVKPAVGATNGEATGV